MFSCCLLCLLLEVLGCFHVVSVLSVSEKGMVMLPQFLTGLLKAAFCLS